MSSILQQVLPECRHKVYGRQIPLHLVSGGFTHPPQNVEASQPQHQFPQQQLAGVVVQHFTSQQFLQGLRAGVRLKTAAQVQEPCSLAAAEFLNDLVDRLQLIHVRGSDRPGVSSAARQRN